MSRELNRDLFQKSTPATGPAGAEGDVAPVTKEDFRVLGFHVDGLVKKVKEYESRIQKLESRAQELTNSTKLRFERVQGAFQRQGESYSAQFTDMHSKAAQLLSRVNETKMAESRIQEMVDRHQQIVQGFETRLQQMHKMMTEQELQLSASRSELKEALKEIARLKRL